MAKNISLLGADYPDVPAVTLPQTGGGTATFYDVEVTDGDPTLAWGTRSTVGTVQGTDLHVTMPAKPNVMPDNRWVGDGSSTTFDSKPFDIVVFHNGSRNWRALIEAGNFSFLGCHGASMTENSITVSVDSTGKATFTNSSGFGLHATWYRFSQG